MSDERERILMNIDRTECAALAQFLHSRDFQADDARGAGKNFTARAPVTGGAVIFLRGQVL